MTLQQTIYQFLTVELQQDKSASVINSQRLTKVIEGYIRSCEPEINDYVGPTSDFKSNLLKGLYE